MDRADILGAVQMGDYEIRELSDGESLPALQLILASPDPLDSPASRVEHFLRSLAIQGLKLDWKLAVVRDGRPIVGCVGIISPGRTALILSSPLTAPSPHDGVMIRILRAIEIDARRRRLVLLQTLAPAEARATAANVQAAGYKYLADLRYLTMWAPRSRSAPGGAAPLALESYAPANEGVFVRTLGKTHQGSLDCPGLEGLRSLEDIMHSHRHTGLHDPSLWLLGRVQDKPVGVLLLTRVPSQRALELVYMGVVPEARGHGYGRRFVEVAIEQAVREGSEYLVLAVDRCNHFALKTYQALGFTETDRRLAWVLHLDE